MLVALTVTPALCLSCCATRRSSARVAAAQRAQARLRAIWRASSARRARARRRGASLLARRRARRAALGSSLLPNFKERDFLMHWVTKPDTSRPRRPDRDPRLRGPARSPACATAARTSARRSWPTRSYGVNFGENWISVDPSADYDKTLAAVQDVVDGYPGLYRDVQTYLRERISEVADRARASRSSSASSAPTSTCSRQGRRDRQHSMADVPGVVDAHVELHENIPQVEVEVNLGAARRYGLKPGDVRAPGRDTAGRARKSVTSSAAARPTTCRCGASRRDPRQPDRHPQPADRHPGRRTGPARRGRRRRDRADPERHRARGRVAPDRRRARTSQAATSARSSADVEARARGR